MYNVLVLPLRLHFVDVVVSFLFVLRVCIRKLKTILVLHCVISNDGSHFIPFSSCVAALVSSVIVQVL